MNIQIFDDKFTQAAAAAEKAAAIVRQSIDERGRASIIAATGAAHFDFLEAFVAEPNVDWSNTTFFHLDEYVGLPLSHPASFRKYLKERIVDRVHPGRFYMIEGDCPDPEVECRRLGQLISECCIDVAFLGIGENGHLAFNDPPADFVTNEPYLVVRLDDACRLQQVGEGWFQSIDEVPQLAISMSVNQILKSKSILCIVPEKRKARAVKDCLELEISPSRPASILKRHSNTYFYLDKDSASLLEPPLSSEVIKLRT